jgi:penicillin-binding protein 2
MSLRSKVNLIIFQTLVFSLMFALFGRLFYLQVLESDKYQDAAISIQSRDVVTPAVRGAITDINGTPMVVDLPGLVVSINRIEIDKQPDKGVKVLAQEQIYLSLSIQIFINELGCVVSYLKITAPDVGMELDINQFH